MTGRPAASRPATSRPATSRPAASRHATSRRNRSSRRHVDSRVMAILTGDCDEEVWEIEKSPVTTRPCGACLPCRFHEVLVKAGPFRWIQADLAERAERRSILRRRNETPISIRNRRARPDRRQK